MQNRLSMRNFALPKFVIAGLTCVFLALIIWGAENIRMHRLQQMMPSGQANFWIESAQRFRGIRLLSEGFSLPDPDVQMQWPDGYHPQHDTLVQEYVLGTLARWVQPADLHEFVRTSSRWLFCSIIIPLFLLARSITKSPWIAAATVAIYAFLPPAVDRSTGMVLYRENVMLPLFAWHLLTLYEHFRRDSGTWLAWLSGLFLLLCHLTWKVTSFYQLYALAFLGFLVVWERPGKTIRGAVFALTVPPLLTSMFLPVSLHFDRYWASTSSAMTLGLLTPVLLSVMVERAWLGASHRMSNFASNPWYRLGIVFLVAVGVRFLLPGSVSYGHALATVKAKLLFWGIKPEDPALLELSARHYWTGNYRSPTVARSARDFLVPAMLMVMLTRRWTRKNPGAIFHYLLEPFRPRPERNLSAPNSNSTEGRTTFLEARGQLYLLFGLLGSCLGYLMFYKFATFVAIFLVVPLALAVQTTYVNAKHRRWLALLTIAGLIAVSYLSTRNGIGAEQIVKDQDVSQQEIGLVYNQDSLATLSTFLVENTSPTDVFLATWALSPYLVTYLNRTTVLNSFFESPMVYRFEAFNLALFNDLTVVHQFCRQYEARYLIYEANMLLRTDKWMSYRYVANHLRMKGNEAAYRLHYEQRSLPGFQLVYQNEFFRVFEVLPSAEIPGNFLAASYAPLFDPQLPGAQPTQSPDIGSRLLYSYVAAGRMVALGKSLIEADLRAEGAEYFRRAVKVCPFHVGAFRELRSLMIEQKQDDAARQLEELATRTFGKDIFTEERITSKLEQAPPSFLDEAPAGTDDRNKATHMDPLRR